MERRFDLKMKKKVRGSVTWVQGYYDADVTDWGTAERAPPHQQ